MPRVSISTRWLSSSEAADNHPVAVAVQDLDVFGHRTTTGSSREMVEAIKKAGGKPKYTEYEGVQHNSWIPAYDSPKTWEWLFAQKRSAREKRA